MHPGAVRLFHQGSHQMATDPAKLLERAEKVQAPDEGEDLNDAAARYAAEAEEREYVPLRELHRK